MNVEDTKQVLNIIGKIFIVLGFLLVAFTIAAFNSVDIVTESDWFLWDDPIEIGIINIHLPLELLYLVPAFYLLCSTVLLVSGFGLVYDQAWAKKLAIVPAVVLLFNFPVGTAIGIFVIFIVHRQARELTSPEGGSPDM